MHGGGKYTWTNGQVYEGEWWENTKHGSGMWQNERGDVYIGEWSDGQASGFGVFSEAGGSSYYKGAFKNGVREGEGIWKKSVGHSDKYEGSFVNNKK
ncbi:unnamed protein product [Sphagnum balticum]